MNSNFVRKDEQVKLIMECRQSGLSDYQWCKTKGMILAGTEYEGYEPFPDAPEYEAYEETSAWAKVVAGIAVAALVGVAVGALVFCTGGLGLVAAGGMAAAVLGLAAGGLTAGAGIAAVLATEASDRRNGTESSVWEYMSNAFTASAKVGASLLLIMAAPYAAEATVYGTIGPYFSMNMLGSIVTSGTLVSLTSGAMGLITTANASFRLNDVTMFAAGQKEMGELTGNAAYDNLKQTTEMLSFHIGMFALMNPRLYGDMKSWFSKAKEQPVASVVSGNVGSGAGKGGIGSVQTISNKFPNDNQVGKRFNYTTENGRIHMENGIQNVDFVIDMDGNLHIGRGHSYLAGGSSVQAAGTMKVNSQGYVRLITNESGHFQPTTVQAMNYPTVFRNAGLNIDNAWIRIGEFETSMSKYVIDSKVFYNGPIRNMP